MTSRKLGLLGIGLLSIAIAPSVLYADLNEQLLHHWRLDEGEGTTAYDEVGDNNGTLHGDSTWGFGYPGSALYFDGGGDDWVEATAVHLQQHTIPLHCRDGLNEA